MTIWFLSYDWNFITGKCIIIIKLDKAYKHVLLLQIWKQLKQIKNNKSKKVKHILELYLPHIHGSHDKSNLFA